MNGGERWIPACAGMISKGAAGVTKRVEGMMQIDTVHRPIATTGQFPLWLMVFCCLLGLALPVAAEDSEQARRTLMGLQGMQVIVEELQPNILKQDKYLQKAGLSKVQLQKDIETKLKAAGIKVLSLEEWSKTPGRPALYVNVNTHESEKYWFAYDIKLELRQVVSLDARPEIKTLANTWGINMTGVVNIGTFNVVRDNVGVLVERFVEAWKTVRRKE